MKRLAAFLFLPLLASAADLPLHPDEAKIIQGIIATEAVEVEVADLPGYAKNGVYQTLEGYGVAAEPPNVKTFVFGLGKTVPEATLTKAGAAAFAELQHLPNLATVEIWCSCKWSEADLKAAKSEWRFHVVGGAKKS